MAWKLIDRPKTLKVTKSLAKSFAEMNPCPHDRPLSERRLMVYERLLNDGLFRPVTWASVLCQETEEVYRVNGKHTSTLLSGLKELPEFFAVIEEYECDYLNDVAKLYATFDSNVQSRNARDIYLSFAATVPEIKECSPKVITAAVCGLSYHKNGSDAYGKTQPAERAELLLDYPEFVLWLNALLTGGMSNAESGKVTSGHIKNLPLYRLPVVAAMVGTWSKAKGPATEFWTQVRDETAASPADPTRKLSRYLLTSGLKGGINGRARVAGNREVYCKSLRAWNAWRKNEHTDLRYSPDGKIPVPV